MFRAIANPVISRRCARQLTTSSVKREKADLTEIKEKQARFQVDNNVPVYLKGGAGDKSLYYATASKLLSRHGLKLFRTSRYRLVRWNNSCCKDKDSNKDTSKDGSKNSPKPEACLHEKEKPDATEPPPCAVTIPCLSRTSSATEGPDPHNPCNYCPPECIDPDAPNIVKLKKKQCHFQQPNGIPIYLKGGKFDVFLYQFTLIVTLISVVSAGHFLYVSSMT